MPPATTETPAPPENEVITIAPEHIEKPAAPEPEVKVDETDSTMDDFLSVKEGIPVAAKKEAPTHEVKVEVKPKIEAALPKTEVKVEPKVESTVDKKTGRDYAGLSEVDVPIFKTMSNAAFDKLKPLYLEHQAQTTKVKELEGKLSDATKGIVKIPESYYEHPLAYALTPEFETASTQAQEAQTIFNHWSQQLKAVQDGAATYKSLVRDASGKIVYGADVPSTKESGVQLLAHFNNVQRAAAEAEGKLMAMQQNHTSRYQTEVASVNKLESDMFSVYSDEKHPAWTKIKATIAELPAAFRNSPLASVLAKSLVTIEGLMYTITKERSERDTQGKAAAKVAATTKEVGPSATGAAAGVQASAITMDDFEKAKE